MLRTSMWICPRSCLPSPEAWPRGSRSRAAWTTDTHRGRWLLWTSWSYPRCSKRHSAWSRRREPPPEPYLWWPGIPGWPRSGPLSRGRSTARVSSPSNQGPGPSPGSLVACIVCWGSHGTNAKSSSWESAASWPGNGPGNEPPSACWRPPGSLPSARIPLRERSPQDLHQAIRLVPPSEPLLYPEAPRSPHAAGDFRGPEQRSDRQPNSLGLWPFHKQPGLLVDDGFFGPAGPAGHHRPPRGSCLQEHDPEPLDLQPPPPRAARHGEHVGRRVVRGEILVRHLAGEDHTPWGCYSGEVLQT